MLRFPTSPVRYFKVTILIGLLILAGVAALQEGGAFQRLDLAWAQLIGHGAAPMSRSLLYCVTAFLAFGIAWTTIDINRTSLKWIIAAGGFAQVITASVLLNLFGIWFSPFGALLAIATGFAAALFYSRGEAGLRKRLVREMFGERVSERTFAALVNSDTPLDFAGERREASMVVCEIFNHEALADALPVPDYVALNNAFLRNAADFLVERGGYLDECDGESLRVVFGAPLADQSHAIAACACALALSRHLDAVNAECARIYQQIFDFRIGVNSGEIVVAAYGSSRLGSFSVAGEPVEFARRLCAANTIYGSRLLIGAATFAQAETTLEVRPMELIQRRPREQVREEVYELLALQNGLTAEQRTRRDLFWKAIVLYREQLWDQALALFDEARPNGSEDGPIEFYLRRIAQLREGLPALEIDRPRI